MEASQASKYPAQGWVPKEMVKPSQVNGDSAQDVSLDKNIFMIVISSVKEGLEVSSLAPIKLSSPHPPPLEVRVSPPQRHLLAEVPPPGSKFSPEYPLSNPKSKKAPSIHSSFFSSGSNLQSLSKEVDNVS